MFPWCLMSSVNVTPINFFCVVTVASPLSSLYSSPLCMGILLSGYPFFSKFFYIFVISTTSHSQGCGSSALCVKFLLSSMVDTCSVLYDCCELL